jgi:hypothetical protein
MVHALMECWRVLVPDGQLIDIRPRVSNPDVEVVFEEKLLIAGNIDDSGAEADYDAADRSMASVVSEGLFSKQAGSCFSFAYYWQTPDQMQTYIDESWGCYGVLSPQTVQVARELSPADQTVRFRVREVIMIANYRKLSDAQMLYSIKLRQ